MQEIILEPKLFFFQNIQSFIDSFKPTDNDFIITNRFIFEPNMSNMGIRSTVLYQENFGSGEPSDEMIDKILIEFRKIHPKRLFAIGGGTIIDIAKVLCVSGSDSVNTLFDKSPLLSKYCELIIVPTTCGTGSEMTNISIINRIKEGTKMGLISPAMFADYAVLVPEFLKNLPFRIFASSSIDALIHASESALSPKATSFTKLFSYKAVEMILNGYIAIRSKGADARSFFLSDFLTASNFSGIAFGTAGCGAVHALSYPLGGTYHVPHGESNYVFFTNILRFYQKMKNRDEIKDLNICMSSILKCSTLDVYDELDLLLSNILPYKKLHEYCVTKEDLSVFTDTVVKSQQRLLQNSFVIPTYNQIYEIYSNLF